MPIDETRSRSDGRQQWDEIESLLAGAQLADVDKVKVASDRGSSRHGIRAQIVAQRAQSAAARE